MTFPTLHQLQIFVAVARRKSFTKAAEELFLSAPSVSLQVQRLEKHYRTRLFERTGHGPILTETGSILAEAAEAVFAQLEEAGRAIERARAPVSCRLNVAATMLIGVYRLPLAIALFRRRFSQTEVNLLVANREQVEEALLSRAADVAVMGGKALSPYLYAEPFTAEQLVLLAHADNPLAHLPVVRTESLAEQVLLMREPGSLTRAALQEAMMKRGLRFKAIVPVEGIEGLIRAVAENRGIGFGPAACCDIELRRGQIVSLRVADFSIEVPFYLVYRAAEPLSDHVVAFMQTCREVFHCETVAEAS